MIKKHIKVGSMLLTLALTIAMIAGCSPVAAPMASSDTASAAVTSSAASEATSQAATTDEKMTLTFWYTYGDGEDAQFKDVVLPMWNKLHPNITIEPVRQDSGQYNQMIVTAFGTGQTPDVARVDIINTAAYAKQGGIVALSDKEDFAKLKAAFLAAPLATNLYQGKYYGFPLDTNCKAAVVNQSTLKTLGLTVAPATMEEFIKASESKGNGKYVLNVSGVGDWDILPYFWLFGGTLTNDDFTKASGYLDSDASVKAVQTMLDLHTKKIFTIRDVDGSVDAWDGIKTGEYAMFFEGPWFFGSYEENAAKGLVPALVPTYNGQSASVVGGENIVVFSGGKHQDAAYEFSKFMVSKEVQLAMLEKGQLPVLSELVNDAKVTGNPVWSVYMKQMESAKARIPSPNQTDISQIWSDAMTNIFVNKVDVKTELTNAAKLIDEKLA